MDTISRSGSAPAYTSTDPVFDDGEHNSVYHLPTPLLIEEELVEVPNYPAAHVFPILSSVNIVCAWI